MPYSAEKFKTEVSAELDNILKYWKNFSVDEEMGGFVGQRDHYNRQVKGASKGIILNTRILWTFSAVANSGRETDREIKELADRAYVYLRENFRDMDFGGVMWEVDAAGKILNPRKQIYAQAFAIYALSEYYQLSKDEDARQWALQLFELIEKHARDKKDQGYLEAFQKDWSVIEDMRLSEKDRNSAKTMNTHLHILEAYTTLYRISGNQRVRKALDNLIVLFLEKFYDPEIRHFHLFFDNHWNREGNVTSYGHDIEAVWLLIEAARASENKDLLNKTEAITVPVAKTFLEEAYVSGRGVANEKDLDSGRIDTDRHWWPQAEAMLGLQYAFGISGEEKFREAINDIWKYTRTTIVDHEHGEWFFRVDENGKPYTNEDKLGMWKCPYHNTRACLILLNLLSNRY